MWPYEGFIPLPDRVLTPDELSEALTRALRRKDAKAARELFDHAFWHNTTFKPDWFHLYVAVQQQDRELVQLMVTYGARWDAQQTAVAADILGAALKPFKHVLAAGGMRIDAQGAGAKPDTFTYAAMNHRIMAENLKSGHVTPEEKDAFNLMIGRLCLQAAKKGDAALARRLCAFHTDAAEGIDFTPVLRKAAFDAPFTLGAQDIIATLDSLRAAEVPLRPLALDKLESLLIRDFYTLVPALHARGLFGGDAARMRGTLWRSWSYAQEDLYAGALHLRQNARDVRLQRAAFTAAAAVLCRQDSPLSPAETHAFAALHKQQATQHDQAIVHMDETLLASGFFDNPAFGPDTLRGLAQDAPTDALKDAFNRRAQRRVIESRGVDHFLSSKRFGELLGAMQSGAYVPSANETRDIVNYLYDRCTQHGVPEDVVTAMTALRDCGARFHLVEPLRYLGRTHPLLAKTMLDLDIITAREIRLSRLKSKIPPCDPRSGLHAHPSNKDYARQEFLYQVMLERSNPDQAAALRGRDVCYQELYARTLILADLKRFFPDVLPRPLRGRSGPRPGY